MDDTPGAPDGSAGGNSVQPRAEADADVANDAFSIKEWQFEARLIDINFIFQACRLGSRPSALLHVHAYRRGLARVRGPQVVMMHETLYIYIGANDSRKMQGLEVALRTKYVPSPLLLKNGGALLSILVSVCGGCAAGAGLRGCGRRRAVCAARALCPSRTQEAVAATGSLAHACSGCRNVRDRMQEAVATTSTVLGDGMDDLGRALAQRLGQSRAGRRSRRIVLCVCGSSA
jgi:hypothetical protein